MTLKELCRESFYREYGGEPSDRELTRLSAEAVSNSDLPLVVLTCRSVENPECSTETEEVVFDFHDIPDGYYVHRIDGRYVTGRCPLCGDFLLEGADGCEVCMDDEAIAEEILGNDPVDKEDLKRRRLKMFVDSIEEYTEIVKFKDVPRHEKCVVGNTGVWMRSCEPEIAIRDTMVPDEYEYRAVSLDTQCLVTPELAEVIERRQRGDTPLPPWMREVFFYEVPVGECFEFRGKQYVKRSSEKAVDMALPKYDAGDVKYEQFEVFEPHWGVIVDKSRPRNPVDKEHEEREKPEGLEDVLENILDIISEATREDLPNCIREMENAVHDDMVLVSEMLASCDYGGGSSKGARTYVRL